MDSLTLQQLEGIARTLEELGLVDLVRDAELFEIVDSIGETDD